ncbi:MAG: hypothetical protein JXR73_00220 [Candidatus Omnitrophica bacterium]|nr:hypothetical protein [Candidatus Omnitrophota bacterium]
MNCIQCQSTRIVTGALNEGVGLFIPDEIKKIFLSVKAPYIQIDKQFSICLDCGFAWSKVYTDLEKAKSILLRWGNENLLKRLNLKE